MFTGNMNLSYVCFLISFWKQSYFWPQDLGWLIQQLNYALCEKELPLFCFQSSCVTKCVIIPCSSSPWFYYAFSSQHTSDLFLHQRGFSSFINSLCSVLLTSIFVLYILIFTFWNGVTGTALTIQDVSISWIYLVV